MSTRCSSARCGRFSASMCSKSAAASIAPRKSRGGSFPANPSTARTPIEKMLLRPPTGSPRSCSGDMYAIVPITVPAAVAVGAAADCSTASRASFSVHSVDADSLAVPCGIPSQQFAILCHTCPSCLHTASGPHGRSSPFACFSA
jgi:hypothetical protein